MSDWESIELKPPYTLTLHEPVPPTERPPAHETLPEIRIEPRERINMQRCYFCDSAAIDETSNGIPTCGGHRKQ
jgi:hypothetical protein